MNKFIATTISFICIIAVFSCARQGTPSGGPKDETPPKVISYKPDSMAVNVPINLKEIIINFDEYIQLKDYTKNAVISPPFKKNPIVSPMAGAEKFLKIKIQDTLAPNTTYNFNFGDAVQDYNENNKLENFSYVFSTGSSIDSLTIQGKVYPGYDFELPKKVLVGLYKVNEAYQDSIVLKEKPYYIARVNEKGEYFLKYLKDGKYKIVAWEDKVENSQFDIGKEKIAFNDSIIDLEKNEIVNLKLFYQKPSFRVEKSEQKGYGHLVFITQGLEGPITITPVDREILTSKIDIHQDKDSINYWFNPKKDKFNEKNERLKFKINYQGKDYETSLLYKNPLKEYEPAYKTINDNKLPPDQDFKLLSSAPIVAINKELINVFKDTVQIPFEASIDSMDQKLIRFKFEKNLEEKFEINAFPKAFIDFFDAPNDTLVYQVSTGVKEDYGNLKVKIQNIPSDIPIILQLVKKSNDFSVIEERKGLEREFYFNYLLPNDYYLRLLLDENKNDKWDGGNFLEGIQPEPVYIYPEAIKIRALWDTEETWIIGPDSYELLPIKEEENNKPKTNNSKILR